MVTRPAVALSFGDVPANALTSPAIFPKDVPDEVAEIASVLEDLLLGVDESIFMPVCWGVGEQVFTSLCSRT